MNKIIDIIFPCYAPEYIVENALNHINQQTARDKIRVIMVNDCSPYTVDNYFNLRNKFVDLDILYLQTPHNQGPAAARNLALKNVQSPYILFHDDDDILQNKFVLEHFINIIEKNKQICSIAGGILTETHNSLTYFTPAQDNNTHFGKIFNNAFIKQNNIQFDEELCYEEDSLFLTEYFLKSRYQYHYFLNNQECVYVRCVNENYNNLTRRDDNILKHNLSFILMLSKKIDLINQNKDIPFMIDLYKQIFIFVPDLFNNLYNNKDYILLEKVYPHLLKIIDYFSFGSQEFKQYLLKENFYNSIKNNKDISWELFFKQFEQIYFNLIL